MKYFGARLSLVALTTATLIGCRGIGDQIPPLPPGTVCTVSSQQTSISGTCTYPPCSTGAAGALGSMAIHKASSGGAVGLPIVPSCSPSSSPSAIPSAMPSVGSSLPPVIASPLPPIGLPTLTPTSTPTPTPVPTIAPLSGIWQWSGLNGQSSGTSQAQGTLPNIALTNAQSGTVTITTSSQAAGLVLTNNSCPQSFGVAATGIAGAARFSVTLAAANCQFTLTDPMSGAALTVYYSNYLPGVVAQ